MKTQVTQNYNPETATAVSDAWKSIGNTFKELATDFTILVNGSQTAWTGKAAEGVRAALNKVGTFADTTGEGFVRTSGAIAQQRDAAVQANRSMPEPVSYSPMDIMKKWAAPTVLFPPAMAGAPFEMLAKHNEQQEAKAEAVQVMQTRDNTMMSAAMSMPTMDSIPQVTQDQAVTKPSSTTSSHSLSNVNANQQFSNNNSTGMPSMPQPSSNNGTTNTAWAAPQVKDPALQPSNNNQNIPPGGQNRPPIGPPGIFPPGMRPPGGGQTGRPGGGGPGGSGAGRGGPGGGGAGGGRGMGPGGMAGVGGSGRGMGSFGPATPGGSAGVMGGSGPGGAANGAGAGAAGRGGAAGAGGMGAGGGAGQGGEEDKEHKSNYLIPTDEFFDDDRMVAPPVIGG
ncbi:hypothetical protein ACSHWB_07520 [Lentzea sp. HUAS TT2]|uniref:hypothetical protein n=1 Tax=Lentzea sp. HUAS TT2 TaxID=3447454 RepID=UPI003F6E6935